MTSPDDHRSRRATVTGDLEGLARRISALRDSAGGRRVLVGMAGEPGAGKSTLALGLAALLAAPTAVVPLDGFHLADVELRRQGLLGRKGAPETFDAWGYAALLARLRDRADHVVFAPGFERDLEQPLAGAIAVSPEVEVVLTEGNYLLLDRPEWEAGRAALDEVWYVDVDPVIRRERLVRRHVRYGKRQPDAERWVTEVDEANAGVVLASRARADLLVEFSRSGGSRRTASPRPTGR